MAGVIENCVAQKQIEVHNMHLSWNMTKVILQSQSNANFCSIFFSPLPSHKTQVIHNDPQ